MILRNFGTLSKNAIITTRRNSARSKTGVVTTPSHGFQIGLFQVQDGSQTRFWEDLWLGKEPLSVKYPALYNLVRKKNMSVAQVLGTTPLNVSFGRALVGVNWDNWLCLVRSVLEVNLNNLRDSFRWTTSKKFSVKDMYNDLVLRSGTPVNCWAWKAKIPLKIKIFLWYLKNGVVLTKDNLVKRQWKGCTKCCFCDVPESIQHLFFDCPMAKLMWGIVSFTFGIKKPTNVGHLFVLGLEVFQKSKGTLYWLGWRLYARPYGSVGTILCFISQTLNLFCR
jgi:hypothetical protein